MELLIHCLIFWVSLKTFRKYLLIYSFKGEIPAKVTKKTPLNLSFCGFLFSTICACLYPLNLLLPRFSCRQFQKPYHSMLCPETIHYCSRKTTINTLGSYATNSHPHWFVSISFFQVI